LRKREVIFSMTGITLLILGQGVADAASAALERGGYRVAHALGLQEAVKLIDRLNPAVVLVAGSTGGPDLEATAQSLKQLYPTIPVMPVTSSDGRCNDQDLLSRVTAVIAAQQSVPAPRDGGLAHEFNNLLAIVLNNIEAARRQLERADPDLVRVRRATDNAADGAARAVALARHLLQGDRLLADPAPASLPLFPSRPTAESPTMSVTPIAVPRILIVEDEVLVRMMAVDALEIHGFEVEEAGTAEAALRRFETAETTAINAVIVDIGLPDRKGDALAADLRARYPALPIVIASGYDESGFRQQFGNDPGMGFLAKPYDSGQLKNALRALGVVAP
jgi:CheY-like chemotaxis protein